MEDETPKLRCPAYVAELVPEALAREIGFFPLEYSVGVLTVAVSAPTTDEVIAKLRFVLNREICLVFHPAEVIRRSLDELYGEWVGQEESIYYWREWWNIREDGAIVLKTRGYDRFGCHWTGWSEFTPNDPDFGLWNWILAQPDRFDPIISGELLEAIREEYQREA